MNNSKQLALLTATALLSSFCLVCTPLQAQTPILPPPPTSENGNPNIDDLPNNPQQMKTWVCNQDNKAITVAAKDVKTWKPIIEGEGWECQEKIPMIAGGEPQLSCEPEEIIGILTVTWLQGKDWKPQMGSWLSQLKGQGLSCTVSKTNPYWE
jgi:hypothetical protein